MKYLALVLFISFHCIKEYTNHDFHFSDNVVSSESSTHFLRFMPIKKRAFPTCSKSDNLSQTRSAITLLLILSGDIEQNPGPRPLKYPCGICHKACKWTTPCVRCDTCKVYYHQDCMAMPNQIFNTLHNISWECFHCGVPNFSTSLFNTTIESFCSNQFEPLCTPQNESHANFSFCAPTATSSPINSTKVSAQ